MVDINVEVATFGLRPILFVDESAEMRDAIELFSRFFTTFRMTGAAETTKTSKTTKTTKTIETIETTETTERFLSFLSALLLAGFNGVNGVNTITGGLLQTPLEFLGDKRARGAVGHAL